MSGILTPLAAGAGAYLATLFSPNLRQQSNKANAVLVVVVIVITAGLKWTGVF
ncbi:hypothetical protein [Notoacmeibacter ruber]|uniref:hypothetical protein n=1 Tax=Notoacmeibacter ruber TaxID=2670375 RepID=UPI00131444A5|nr:hypothetical protein [Notoacmeibacter ruber]